jgi:hypothetical protein
MQSPDRASSVQLSLYPALEWLLRASVALVLLGRAWQHLRYDTALSALVWSPELFSGIAQSWFGMQWHEWATSSTVLAGMRVAERLQGGLYLAGALVALFPLPVGRSRRAQVALLWASSLGLLLLAGLTYLDNKRDIAQLLELSIQVCLPAVLAAVLSAEGRFTAAHQRWLQLAIAATFAGHGLYAVGYYEVPGQFVTMVMRSLHVSQSTALDLLMVAGGLDFVIAASSLVAPRLGRFGQGVLLYAAAWGTLTALARVWSFFRWDLTLERLAQWLHKSTVRLPHGLVPLLVLLVLMQQARLRELRLGEGT